MCEDARSSEQKVHGALVVGVLAGESGLECKGVSTSPSTMTIPIPVTSKTMRINATFFSQHGLDLQRRDTTRRM